MAKVDYSKFPLFRDIDLAGLQRLQEREHVFGPTPPNVFVGRVGYPDINWGPLVSVDADSSASMPILDNPAKWYGMDYGKIVEMQISMVRSKSRLNVSGRTALLEKAQDAVMSVKPVDAEITFAHKPHFNMDFSHFLQPMGSSAPLKDFTICDNPVVPKKVDELIEEKVKASDAASELYDNGRGHDVYYLTRLLSAGILGRQGSQKLVPTRWSITAVDDMIAKQMLEKIREAPEISDYQVYSSEFLYNHFEILLMPGRWEFEQFEAWAAGSFWDLGKPVYNIEHEYEPFEGRTAYADQEGGGYYAGRLGVVEALARRGRQARAVIFREIGSEYNVPVGVWTVREASRHAMAGQAKRFTTMNEALAHLSTKLKIPISEYRKRSSILPQTRLSDF
ncbi:MAG: Nre family DNA repair protein [Candidatus Burarchaeum sp.]|nr:Nre family DNA repair protein [Candidatus Burarchaeum sp.]MDO8339107.1 Nre family DNA repair protein [Candidatus Burarchaeum sp.]